MKKIFIIFPVVFVLPSFGYIVDDFTNMCGVQGYRRLYAVPRSFTCASGQFLPANAYNCVACPNNYTCSGGEYYFNSLNAQGLTRNSENIFENEHNTCSSNLTYHVLNGSFTPKVYTCTPGYYLPANVDGCTKCQVDSYCPGGTYTFSETESQGITLCPIEHPYAPAGMWLATQCGRKLHIGNEVMYLHLFPSHPTEHGLYVRVENTTYSANAVARDMNSDNFPKMSVGAEKGLHVNINGVEYLVCDDSVLECRND